ncbi:MAG: NAD(P)H-quinone oxidoreductase [Rickettsiales bacterium]|nr:NAD(P)H-quinone oxidoreductase [Rickettsiales bacterium]|tara:strand:+ start:709 stop:1683 length:975 start_codon:yes stop_codon:yes gene_type:complete
MKAITFDQPGAYKVLKISEVELPLPNKDQILIKVVCAGVNRPDIVQREGNYPPPKDHSTILGLEVSGYVEKVGNNVQDFSVGDKVAALVNGGGYAEYCIAEYQSTFHIPGDLSFDEAACIPECFFTVWSNLVMRGKLKNKQKVLIHGGTSGIGLAAIQVTKIFDSLVITTVGNNEKVLFCENLGVDKVINYKEQDFFDEIKKSNIGDVDLILDYIGGDYISKNINLLNTDGSLINIGFMKGSKSELNLMKVMLKRLNITGSTLRIRNDNFKGRILSELKKFVFPLLIKREIKCYIDSSFDLKNASDAHKRLDEGKHIGKIVLKT